MTDRVCKQPIGAVEAGCELPKIYPPCYCPSADESPQTLELLAALRGVLMSHSFSSRTPLRLARVSAVLGLFSTSALVVAPQVAGALTVASSFSIDAPGSLSGVSGQAITPVQFTSSNVDASTAPATTSVKWTAVQLPAGLVLSSAGRLSGTLSTSIPGGLYDVKVVATEKVATGSRGQKSTISVTADSWTHLSVSGAFAFSSNPTIVASGFSRPQGVAVDSSGNVFVADTWNSRIVKMNSDGTNPTVIGSGFSQPQGMAIDSSGNVFIADTWNSRIVKMNSDGTNQTIIGSGFSYPTGVAVDSLGNVFVADTSNGRVVEVDSDGSTQHVIGSGLSTPKGVAVDSLGNVFVAETGGPNDVIEMKADGSNQHVIASGFTQPHGVAADNAGHLFVANYNFNTGYDTVVEMNADGTNQTTIASGFSRVGALAVDSSTQVFVADMYNDRIIGLNAGFRIPNQAISGVQVGHALGSTQIVSASLDPSTSPMVTSVKWFASDLPAGLKLSSSGVLSGTPKAALAAGTYAIYLTATEKVTTKVGTVKTVTTKTASQVLQILLSG